MNIINYTKNLKSNRVIWAVALFSLIFFLCSSVRHSWLQSNAFELGIYDQVAYLISQGQRPFSSFLDIHHMGNHAASVMYPVALLYKIYPDVHWLLFVQALSLALGALPSWSLARQAGLNHSISWAIAFTYLLYPLVFNVNLFDFHPEVIALPALLAAILAARLNKTLWFCVAIILVLSCKAVLSLTVAAMGLWLLFFEKNRNCGLIALFLGAGWFLIATQGVIPYFNQGREHAGIGRYQYLGKSVLEIAVNLILKPHLILGRLFSLDTLEYLVLLVFPVIWWISPRHLTPLISAVPMLGMNILSDIPAQRDLIHQYSIPILPFLLVAAIANLSHHNLQEVKIPKIFNKLQISSLPLSKVMITWSFIAFLCLAKYGYFWTIYLNETETVLATKEAIALVQTKGNILTTSHIAPHLTHRPVVKLTQANTPPGNLTEFEYVLLNLRYPGWMSDRDFVQNLVTQLTNNPQFQLKYQRDDIYLFTKK
ncbi:DUF2079 domain-containing protein [Tychonema sp. BBK16]|uniref:DUF2079 domain-containing protein n=1 Tax=Tychonema sp. BBK16 TaxID=2699888 RepID=UPI001F311D39|nr:DUF2079 domain-containing protein [Tychonema sp. BBK16]MCF6375141.1 DUF2079 domain-containing protein [Tychonema sp. BBK16]